MCQKRRQHKKSAAQEIPGPTDKNNHFTLSKVMSSLREFASLCGDSDVSEGVYQLELKNCFTISGITLYPTSLDLTNFCDTKKDFGRDPKFVLLQLVFRCI